MSSSSARPDSNRRFSKLGSYLLVALLVAYPVVACWLYAYGGEFGEAALWFGAVPQVFCYLGLLWIFGRSLLGQREALITQVARFVHGELSPVKERYTRQVTIYWCVFFAGMALISVFLLLFVSVEAWLFFANVLNLPLLGCAFVAEYAYRLVRLPEAARDSFTAPIRAYRRFRGSAGND